MREARSECAIGKGGGALSGSIHRGRRYSRKGATDRRPPGQTPIPMRFSNSNRLRNREICCAKLGALDNANVIAQPYAHQPPPSLAALSSCHILLLVTSVSL